MCIYSDTKRVACLSNNGEAHSLNKLWYRRQTTKFNGAPYIIQKGAAAIYSEEGQKQIKATVDYYMENAKIIREWINKYRD